MEIWTREVGQGQGTALFAVVFPELVSIDDLKITGSRHGWPKGRDQEGVSLEVHEHGSELYGMVAGLFSDAVTMTQALDLGLDIEALVTSPAVAIVKVTSEEPEDLSHLQVGWALARALTELGAVATIDLVSLRFFSPEGTMELSDSLDMSRELRVDHWAGGMPAFPEEFQEGSDALFTRGLEKFGAPDLLLTGAAAKALDYEAARSLLLEAGEHIALRGGAKELTFGQHRFALSHYEPGAGGLPDFDLNAGVVLSLL